MKTVPFGDILAESCQLVGLDRAAINDKTFGAIRDFCSRRISMIWDREEWPDVDRYTSVYPGVPVSAVTAVNKNLVTDGEEPLVTESGEFLVFEAANSTMDVTLDLGVTRFQRVYLEDFSDNAFRDGLVGQTKLKVQNGFYITLDNGAGTYDVSDDEYEFTYTSATDSYGTYIATVTITVPSGTISGYGTTINGKSTPVITFNKNPQYLVVLPTPVSQGLEVWEKDSRITSRRNVVDFIVEDFSQTSDFLSDQNTYLRFADGDLKHIKYRLTAPRLTGLKYNALSQYKTDTGVYFDIGQGTSNYSPSISTSPTNGDFWIALNTAPAGVSPDIGSAYWSRLEIPRRFKDYLVNGTSADFLRSEGRADEAVVLDNLAEVSIQQQIDVYIRQQGQNQRMNMMFTY